MQPSNSISMSRNEGSFPIFLSSLEHSVESPPKCEVVCNFATCFVLSPGSNFNHS